MVPVAYASPTQPPAVAKLTPDVSATTTATAAAGTEPPPPTVSASALLAKGAGSTDTDALASDVPAGEAVTSRTPPVETNGADVGVAFADASEDGSADV